MEKKKTLEVNMTEDLLSAVGPEEEPLTIEEMDGLLRMVVNENIIPKDTLVNKLIKNYEFPCIFDGTVEDKNIPKDTSENKQ